MKSVLNKRTKKVVFLQNLKHTKIEKDHFGRKGNMPGLLM